MGDRELAGCTERWMDDETGFLTNGWMIDGLSHELIVGQVKGQSVGRMDDMFGCLDRWTNAWMGWVGLMNGWMGWCVCLVGLMDGWPHSQVNGWKHF